MPGTKVEAVFHIDFGMTGSAGEGIRVPSQNSVSAPQVHLFGKIPTTMCYDSIGNALKFGERFIDSDTQTTHFKSRFPTRNSTPGTAQPSKTIGQLISDYLRYFCGELLHQFLRKEGITKQQLSLTWYFTTPGCWSKRVQLDFQGFAHSVVVDLLPDSVAFVDISESLASCEFLVDHLQLEAGIWAITCDIGGATIDTAICLTQKVDGKTIPEAFPIALKGASQECITEQGVYMLDLRFRKYLGQIATKLRITSVAAQKEVLNIWLSDHWQSFRHEFQGEEDFTFTLNNDLGVSIPNCTNGVFVKGRSITIPSSTISSCFEPFFQHIFSELDMAIAHSKRISKGRQAPDLIALCGGGGFMAYLLKQSRLRYGNIPIKAPKTIELSSLATITGHRIYRLRTMTYDYLANIQLGISQPGSCKDSLKSIDWLENPSRISIFQFLAPAGRKTQAHYFLIHLKGGMRPEQFSVDGLTRESGSGDRALVWRLEVHLARSWIGKQGYSITAELIGCGRGAFSFQAHDTHESPNKLEMVSEPYYCLN